MRRLATRRVADALKRQTRKASGALMAASIFQALSATFIVVQLRARGAEVPPLLYLLLYGISSMFFGLCLAARKNPYHAAIAGLVLFVTIHALDAVFDSRRLSNGLVFKGIIISILIRAVIAGRKYRRISRTLAAIDGAT